MKPVLQQRDRKCNKKPMRDEEYIEEINIRFFNTEECISNLENRIMEITKSEKQNEKHLKK